MEKIKKIIKKIFRKIFSNNKDVTFYLNKINLNSNANIVQIGSNDGKTGDPIFDLFQKNQHWKGLFVEPVPYLFEKLKNNYANGKRCAFENVAINDGSKQTFYYVDKEAQNHFDKLPNWFDQLGSFNKENIVKHLDGKLEKFVKEIQIQGITLDNLLIKNDLKSIDLLHIDTEGYDWKILSQLNLDKYLPTIILFEHKHLETNERKESINFLEPSYTIYDIAGDYLCVSKKDNIKKFKRLKKAKLF